MSRSPDVKYHRLSQSAVSDDEDEGFSDNILFDSRLVNGSATDDRNVFELEELGLPRIRTSNGYSGNKRRRRCIAAGIVILLVVATGCGIAIPFLKHSSSPGTVTSLDPEPKVESAPDWTLTFHQTWTESSVFLLDVDKDKLDDIVIGLADQSRMEDILNRPQNVSIRQFCKSKGLSNPCGATVRAFRGLDGKLLWETATRSVVIHQTCLDMEVAGDLKTCVLTGRHATCQAVEASTGHILWSVDPDFLLWSSHFVPTWNVYQAVVVPDMDGDTVLDVLVSHGGDKDKEPWDHDRKAGRLILLSGLNGTPIGTHYLELPDSKETYMPPVKYVTPSGAIYILIGTGGETIQGSLLAISLPDVYRHVTGSDWSGMDKQKSVKYDWLDSMKKDQSGFVVLLSGKTKGIMVPPVLVDTNKDGHLDLIVTSFDGRVTSIDGLTLKENWSRSFDGMETYSSPTPGFYNEDSYLDWLVHFNEGEWDKYNSSRSLILNGQDGKTLWSTQSQSYAYSSDLSIQVERGNSHVYVMKLVGMNSSVESVQKNVGLKKRHLGHSLKESPKSSSNLTFEEFQMMCNSVGADMRQRHATCEEDLNSLTQNVLLFDQTLRSHPLRILQQDAERIHYQLDHKPGTFHCHSLSERYKDKINMCMVLTPTSYTGAVGDVDGDKQLDYIHVTQMVGTRQGDTYNPVQTVSKVILSKYNLQTTLDRKEFVHLLARDGDGNPTSDDDVIDEHGGDASSSSSGGVDDGGDGDGSSSNSIKKLPLSELLRQHVDSIVFRSLQGWCQYLGCRGDSWYHVPAS